MAKGKRTTLKSTPQRESQKPSPDRFGVLLEEAEKFCEAMVLPKDLIRRIIKSDSDWAFVLKVDALMESAAKEILRTGLQIKLRRHTLQNQDLEEFVEALPMNGRTSLLKLLKAARLPDEELGFVESVRKIRNAYAHDIRCADLRVVELIQQRGDKSQLLKHLSAIATYDEPTLISWFEKDPSFFRFCMIDSVMRVLFYAYHLAVKKDIDPERKVTLTLSVRKTAAKTAAVPRKH